MFKEFLNFCSQKIELNAHDGVLLTLSGGKDSMTLLHLFQQSKFDFAVAHCNFHLRGEESNRDQQFVEDYCRKNHITLYIKDFDTALYAKENKVSIQMAARELRYQWFEELRKQISFKYIATAHHLNDQVETFFINLIRGTGIAGLHGIKPKANHIIRPLLFADSTQIKAYIDKNQIQYVEDSSNASDKYLRNKLRHQLLPFLEDLNPNFIRNLAHTTDNIADIEEIFKIQTQQIFKSMLELKGESIYISIPKLLKINNLKAYFHEFLSLYDFNPTSINDAYESLQNDKSGLRFFSSSHKLLKTSDEIIISPYHAQDTNNEAESIFFIDKDFRSELPINLSFDIIENKMDFSKTKQEAYFNMDQLSFPLILRHWQEGDSFYPFGMKGKKLLSDFFIDEKINLDQRKKMWLLCSGEDIIWVVGNRTDERYRISSNIHKVLKIAL